MQCCMCLCENTSENFSTCGRITFHGFPSEASLRAAWLRALGIQDSQLPDSAVVCSQHFLHDDICETESGSRQLRTGAVPSTVLVCMTCLDTDSKMSPISQFNLEEAYEKLTGHPLWDGGNLKQILCVQCAQQLRNFSRFREQSLRARSLMLELLEKHEVITIQHIKMIQHANTTLRNNLVSTTLGPDPCDRKILGNFDEDRQTGSKYTVQEVTVKTEVSEGSQWEDEDTRIKEEANADYVKEEFNIELFKCENAAFTCSVCCEQFPHEHACSAHARTHLHDVRPAAASAHTAGAKKVELSLQTVRDVSSHNSLYAHTAREDAQYRAASEDEVAATHEEPAASVLSGTEPGTSGHGSRTRTFTCNVCERAFTRKDHLVRHMKCHTDERPYPCKICSYKFAYKSHLVTHMRTHTGEKPYSCEICSYQSAENSNLVRHMKTHTDAQPYSCEICGNKFMLRVHLVKHMRMHTSEVYSCETCSYRCTKKGDLVRHMRTHTGEKPYSCEICGHKFTQKGHLTEHLRTHTGEKPYSCKICGYKFTQKGHLATHMRTHTVKH